MATHEPLSDEQLAFYKKILTERKRELLKQVLNQDEDLDEIRGDVAADPLDAAGQCVVVGVDDDAGQSRAARIGGDRQCLAKN